MKEYILLSKPTLALDFIYKRKTLTFAPASSRILAHPTWSPRQASWSGVTWSIVSVSTLYP